MQLGVSCYLSLYCFFLNYFFLKVNSELLANLGNFVHRALSFLSSFFSGTQPSIYLSPIEDELFIRIDEDLKEFIFAMENVRMRDALHHILSISRRGNQYMQAGQPWVLIKSEKEEDM
jgi:methionyl-tRNA synthetase